MPERKPSASAPNLRSPRTAMRTTGRLTLLGALRRYLGFLTLRRGGPSPVPPSPRAAISPKKPHVVLMKKLRLAIPPRTRGIPTTARRTRVNVRTVKKILLPPTSPSIPSPKIEDIGAMEQSLRQYMERKSIARQPPRVPPVPVREPPSALPDDEAVLSGWRKFLRFLPFFSATLLETKQKTQTLEQKLAEHERRTREMALRLHEAELRLQERAQQEGHRETLQRSSIPLPSSTAAASGRASAASGVPGPHGSIRGPSTAPSRSAPSENDQETAGAGRLLAAEKRQETPTETLEAGDLAGLKRAAKDTSTFGLVEKEKRGILGSLFSGIREMGADFRQASEEAATDTAARAGGENAPAPPATAPSSSSSAHVTSSRPAETGAVEKEANAGVLASLLSDFKDAGHATEKDGKSPTKAELPKLQERTKTEVAKQDVVIHVPIRRRARSSGFAEFLGSFKYFGLGKERIGIVQNLATMLNAGLPLVDAIKTLQMETKNKSAKKLLQHIINSVEDGNALWRAMDEQHFFSPHAIALIRIGEEAGNLAENMQYLAAQEEKDQGLRGKVKMAMIYPAIVLTLMFIVVMGLGMFVLPSLIGVLTSLNVKLPLATRLVIAFTNGFTTYGSRVIPGVILGGILLAILGKFTRFKVVVQWFVFHIPGIGRLARESTIARFGVILGGLLQAGVPLVESLRSLVEVTPTVVYRRFYSRLLDHINVGDSFAKSFAMIRGSERFIPISMQQLVITGERTGSLAKIMLKIADIYEKQANDTAQKLPVILEPMLLLFIGALVGTIAFAIIVPIYSIVGNVSGH